ncbi:selenocysteine-tRNA-specific elongation factor [Trypanosoma cruzi]|nr:selenocysteine-tRNA-specific elongation factor [Trypanosoma cruzi]
MAPTHARRWHKYTVKSIASFDGLGRVSIRVSPTNLAGERRRINTQNSQSNSGNYIFLFCCRCLPIVPLEEDSGSEGQVLHFLALDVTTWAPRAWNEGISEVVVNLRSAYSYKYWHQADAQFQAVFDGLVSCRRALETERDPADRFIDLLSAVLQTFQLHITMTTESSVPISELRARLRTQQQRSLRCRLCRICGRDAFTCNVRSTTRGNCLQRRRPSKTAEGPPHAAYGSGRRQPHSFHHLPPIPTGVAPRRRCPARCFELPDTIVEKGSGTYPPTTLDCVTSHRRLRFGPAA